jgi:head-tail adaptor
MGRKTGFPSGKLDTRITILRRPPQDPSFRAGNTRADYEPAFSRWAGIFERAMARQADAGAAQNVVSLVVTMRDDSQTRTISIEDRIQMMGQDMAITGIGLPDRIGQTIQIDVESRRA